MFNLFWDHGDSTTYNKLPIWFLYVLLYTISLALLDNVIKALMEFLKGTYQNQIFLCGYILGVLTHTQLLETDSRGSGTLRSGFEIVYM